MTKPQYTTSSVLHGNGSSDPFHILDDLIDTGIIAKLTARLESVCLYAARYAWRDETNPIKYRTFFVVQRDWADKFGISRQGLNAALQRLVDMGIFAKVGKRRIPGTGQQAVVYRIADREDLLRIAYGMEKGQRPMDEAARQRVDNSRKGVMSVLHPEDEKVQHGVDTEVQHGADTLAEKVQHGVDTEVVFDLEVEGRKGDLDFSTSENGDNGNSNSNSNPNGHDPALEQHLDSVMARLLELVERGQQEASESSEFWHTNQRRIEEWKGWRQGVLAEIRDIDDTAEKIAVAEECLQQLEFHFSEQVEEVTA